MGQMLWAEAKGGGWEQGYETQIIGDGAPWIWNLAEEHFFDSLHTLDGGHVAEHLPQAAELLYAHNPDRSKRWLNQAEQIALDLRHPAEQNTPRSKALQTAANYFDPPKRRTQYLEFREEG